MADHNIKIVTKSFFDWKTKGKKTTKEDSLNFSIKCNVETMKMNIMQSLKRRPCTNCSQLKYGVITCKNGAPALDLYSVSETI